MAMADRRCDSIQHTQKKFVSASHMMHIALTEALEEGLALPFQPAQEARACCPAPRHRVGGDVPLQRVRDVDGRRACAAAISATAAAAADAAIDAAVCRGRAFRHPARVAVVVVALTAACCCCSVVVGMDMLTASRVRKRGGGGVQEVSDFHGGRAGRCFACLRQCVDRGVGGVWSFVQSGGRLVLLFFFSVHARTNPNFQIILLLLGCRFKLVDV
jgi:hypothetical protein